MGDPTFARRGASTGSFGSGEELPKHLGLATGRVKRITMFKIPDLGNQQKLVDAYKVLEKRGNKVVFLFPIPALSPNSLLCR
jgi:hypothetical protein